MPPLHCLRSPQRPALRPFNARSPLSIMCTHAQLCVRHVYQAPTKPRVSHFSPNSASLHVRHVYPRHVSSHPRVNPDTPQKMVRHQVLTTGKTLLTPQPRLRTGFFSTIQQPGRRPPTPYKRSSDLFKECHVGRTCERAEKRREHRVLRPAHAVGLWLVGLLEGGSRRGSELTSSRLPRLTRMCSRPYVRTGRAGFTWFTAPEQCCRSTVRCGCLASRCRCSFLCDHGGMHVCWGGQVWHTIESGLSSQGGPHRGGQLMREPQRSSPREGRGEQQHAGCGRETGWG